MSKKWVAYVGPFNFPWGQPGSRRVYGNAITFMALGYDVRIGSGDPLSETVFLEQNVSKDTSLCYQGLGELEHNASFFHKSWAYLFAWGKNTSKWLSNHAEKPAFVVLYGGMGAYAYHILNWCRQNKVPAIVDVVEWYDPRQIMGGRFGPFYASFNLAMHYFYPRYDGVIAISSLLQQHFAAFCPVICVPPTITSFDENTHMADSNSNCPLRLVYAGTAGKKDMLGLIIEAVKQVSKKGVNIQLLVIGATLTEIEKLGVTDEDSQVIIALGRIPQVEVRAKVHDADFSLLIRESLRFANAGFPTKFVESMSVGTPVIANKTSDLATYLIDGVTGFLVAEPTLDFLSKSIQRAAELSLAEKQTMRKETLAMAKKSFDASIYAPNLEQFLAEVTSYHISKTYMVK